ncbi:MAG: hypothetical protein M0R34_00370 [Candidatus Marinimicrobia bacterium]|nr:hypothetical protein [Candidatus Neomarinimicrobiota bacterium]
MRTVLCEKCGKLHEGYTCKTRHRKGHRKISKPKGKFDACDVCDECGEKAIVICNFRGNIFKDKRICYGCAEKLIRMLKDWSQIR